MKKYLAVVFAGVVLVCGPRVAAQSSSPNFRVDESTFSSGSGTGSSSNFSSQVSAGDLGVGFGYSANYTAYAGPINPNEEYLELFVASGTLDLDTASGDPGILREDEVATGTTTFYVRAYLNSSYAVSIASPTLTNESGDTIDPITSAAASSPGSEQFGLNLVDNASPDIGANVALQPDASFANGEAATGYDTADQFQFNQGDTIAQHGGAPAWGQTNYTISYIANISTITEAGEYSTAQTLIVVPTF